MIGESSHNSLLYLDDQEVYSDYFVYVAARTPKYIEITGSIDINAADIQKYLLPENFERDTTVAALYTELSSFQALENPFSVLNISLDDIMASFNEIKDSFNR